MNLNNAMVADLESDGLLDTVSKIHVLSVGTRAGSSWTIECSADYAHMAKVFSDPSNVIVMHNGIAFDKVVAERILKVEVKATLIDSLALAWYIDHKRDEFGLGSYGETFGVPKPAIDDWVNLSYEEYAHRCSEDVKINIRLWEHLLWRLRQLYDSELDIVRLIKYLNFIMQCASKQEEQRVMVDLVRTQENLNYFESLKEVKVQQLKEAMPKQPIIRVVNKPKVMYKKDGSLSSHGQRWMSLNPKPTDEKLEIVTGYEPANPNSVPQKKAWLYSLGWKPATFQYKRDKITGSVRKIEQILTEEKTLCPSVLRLAEKEPAIEVLDGVSVLTHRIGLFKALQDNQVDGYVKQGLTRLAVSLRWQHSVIVNFPRVTGTGDIRDGKWIRECIVAGAGNKFVQSDLSGIESRTSDHYTSPLNPGLIEETKQKYFDPHTKVAVASNLMTPDEEVWFKWKKANSDRKDGEPALALEEFGTLSPSFIIEDEKKLMSKLKKARSKAKTTNYASLYQVGAPTLSRSLDIPQKEAQKLIDAYWNIHWAVKEVTKTFKIKTVNGELWVLNPISRFWHHLRKEKDAFSTVNQSSAVYCFNMWIYHITKRGLWPVLQSHDDGLWRVKDGEEQQAKEIILKAMEEVNQQLKLNVELACEVQIGDNLSETH